MFPEDRFLEFLIIGALALIVIGPKDLPVLMRRLGRAVGKLRAMAAEFRASFDELARQSELEELRKEVEAMRLSQAGVSAPQMTPFPPPPAPPPGPPTDAAAAPPPDPAPAPTGDAPAPDAAKPVRTPRPSARRTPREGAAKAPRARRAKAPADRSGDPA